MMINIINLWQFNNLQADSNLYNINLPPFINFRFLQMVKKDITKQKSKVGLKKGQIKRKQMFNELQTLQQKRISQIVSKDQFIDAEDIHEKKIDQQQSQFSGQYGNKIKQKGIQQVCEAVNQLMIKNKIGVKNAFQVPMIDLQDLMNLHQNQSQNSWKTISSTLQNDYKIYGYRVDAIHSIAYSILNIMSRRQQPTGLEQKKTQGTSNISNNMSFLNLKQQFIQNSDHFNKTLQKNLANINISNVQCAVTSEPILQRTKRLFDQVGLKGLLTNNIKIDTNLVLPLYSSKSHHSYSMKLSELKQTQVNIIENPFKILQATEKINISTNKLLRPNQRILTSTTKQLQHLWTNIKNRNFNDWTSEYRVYLDVQDPQIQNSYLMIDQNLENHPQYLNTPNKRIEDFLKIKNQKPNKKITTDEDLILDGHKWMNEMDRKFLGIKSENTSKANQIISSIISKNKQRNLDDVNFDVEIEERTFVLKKQNPTKQFNEQVQDQFLMMNRQQMNQFKIQKILTLRQQPNIQLKDLQQENRLQNEHDHFFQRQIDIKRQMTSIKDLKQDLQKLIFNEKKATFSEVYNSYIQKTQDLSPALGFLTMLHLANQNNLIFQSTQGEMDFFIKTYN